MDKSWMTANRLSQEYGHGVAQFVNQAVGYYGEGRKIPCPCLRCGNIQTVSSDQLKGHLIMYGIDRSYQRWIWHGEANNISLNRREDEEEEDHEGERLEDMIHDIEDNMHGSGNEFDRLFSDAKVPLYPGCSKFTQLSFVLKLFNLKAGNGWSDKSFTALLELLKDVLPNDNVLPSRTYEAKKMLSYMGMSYEKIHACPNDCILYRKEYASLNNCPSCKAPRYKKENVPSKVLWYFPIIPRLKRMFRNPETAKNLMWHETDRIKDGKLRHPADSPQWRYIDAKYPEFAKEGRNLRLALSTDGMSPNNTTSKTYSMWPVLTVIYNLPPWLCMKRKYMMLSMLISGPKQPGNDIDVYLAPLIEDLKLLWEEGVEAFDAHKQETFRLQAALFCTINDFPALGNVSGYSVKGHHACPVCGMNTCYTQLKCSSKPVYLAARTFLPKDHEFRNMDTKFNGKIEKEVAKAPLTGEQIYEMVKDIKTTFGKKDEFGKKKENLKQ